MFSLPPLEEELHIALKGVYLGVLHHPDTNGVEVYVGSSYGKRGLGNRILNNHRNATHRRGVPQKILYQAINRDGAITNFLRLATYPPNVLTEAVCTAIFGTIQSPAYLGSRHLSLPPVDKIIGLNRCGPVQTWEEGSPTFGTDATLFRRLRLLDNCLRSGSFQLSASHKDGYCIIQFFLWRLWFTIPANIVREWGLVGGEIVNIEWSISNGPHLHQ